jgi:hypothetical protein
MFDWSQLLGSVATLWGANYQANAQTKAAEVAAQSAREAQAQQLAEFNQLQAAAHPQVMAAQGASGLLGTATGLNGSAAQQQWGADLLNNGAFKSANAFANAETMAKMNATGASPVGGNALSALEKQNQAAGLGYQQQNIQNLLGVETAGNQALGAVAPSMATLGLGAANATQNAGLDLAGGISSSAGTLAKGVAGATPGLLQGFGFTGSTGVAA